MSVSFYYDTMPRVTEFQSCYNCEMPSSPQFKALSKEQYNAVQEAFSRAVLRNDDSPEVKRLLSLVGRPECTLCEGKGWYYHDSLQPTINWSNGNAAAVLSAMGYRREELYAGDVPISEFRRAYIRALNKDLGSYVREEEIGYGKPREVEPGVIDLKPIRFMSAGLSKDQIKSRLDQIGSFLNEAIENKATRISWG